MTSPAADGVRRRRRSDDLRRRLVVAGRRLFSERGYQATTQKQIAAAAGVSTSVLFRNFGSKSQVLLEAVLEPFGEFAEDVLPVTSAPSGDEFAEQFVRGLIARLGPHRELLRSLLSALPSADGDPLMAQMGARLDQLVAEISAGPWPVSDRAEIDIRLAIGMTTTLIMLDDWLLPPGSTVNDERIVGMLTSMVTFAPGRGGAVKGARPRLKVPGTGPPEQAVRATDAARRNSDEVRSALLESATRLFAEQGFSATGYRDIAVAAGTSESVLYRHFGTKSNLLAEAVLQPFMDSFEAASRGWAGLDLESRRARQPQVVGELYSTFSSNRHLVRVLMGLAHDPKHDDLNTLTAEWFARAFAVLGSLSQERAIADRITPYEPELRIRAVVAMVMAAATLDDWFFAGNGSVVGGSRVVVAMSDFIDRGRSGQ